MTTLRRIAAPIVLPLFLAACQPAEEGNGQPAEETAEASTADHVVDVVARDFAFEAPDSIPSGWTTFRLENAGQQEHFLYLGRLPEGRTFSDYEHGVAVPFDSLWQRYAAGELDRSGFTQALMEAVPEWFASAEIQGGTGLVAPGRTTRATVQLEPGDYWMECYVKSPEGDWHTSLGMTRALTVTADTTGAPAPEADLELTVAGGEIQAGSAPSAGRQTVAVHFGERPPDALFMSNDVHLARLGEGGGTEELAAWMDWWREDGFRAPAPAEFLGGAQDQPAGETAYFTVTLEPGRYAWVMEAPVERSAVETFTVE